MLTEAGSTVNQLQHHPYADVFQMMSPSAYAGLRDDIRDNGLLVPIVLFEGLILDGRNRYKACVELGIEPATITYTGKSPIAHMGSLNIHRRHLSKSQVAAYAQELWPNLEAEAKRRQGRCPVQIEQSEVVKGQVRDILGKAFGVGGFLVGKAKKVKESDPELFDSIKRGEITVDAAYKQVKAASASRSADDVKTSRSREEIAVKIRELAQDGHNARQIADLLGRHTRTAHQTIAKIAREYGITLPDAAIGKTHRINATRMIDETAHGLAGYAQGLETLGANLTGIDRQQASIWLSEITESLRRINRLVRQLRSIANEQG